MVEEKNNATAAAAENSWTGCGIVGPILLTNASLLNPDLGRVFVRWVF